MHRGIKTAHTTILQANVIDNFKPVPVSNSSFMIVD